MAIRQYVGARYVTKIYENSLDPSSAEWEANVTYEPLTLVTYNNSSYLSKKEVPGSIGNPAANPLYWVVTGAYNGQILNLQNQIDQLILDYKAADVLLQNQITANADDISLINNHRYIVVTDSYGNHVNSSGRNFIEEAFNILGITDYYDCHYGGSGFTKTGAQSFRRVLSDRDAAIPDKDTITDIIVCGCANDYGATEAAILSGMNDFMSYVKNIYPNAVVHVGAFTRTIDSNYIANTGSTVRYYMSASIQAGMKFIDNSQWVMRRLSYYNNSDGVHPTSDGVNAIADALAKYVKKGSFSIIDGQQNCFSLSDNTWGVLSDRTLQMFNNGQISLVCTTGASNLYMTMYSAMSLTAGVNTISDFLTMTEGFMIPQLNNSIVLMGLISDSAGHTYQAWLYLKSIQNYGIVKLGMQILAPSGGTLASGTLTFTFPATSYQIFA